MSINSFLGSAIVVRRLDTPPVCSQDPDLWFSDDPSDRKKAMAFCATCEVSAACSAALAAMPTSQRYGIWGGSVQLRRDGSRFADAEAAA